MPEQTCPCKWCGQPGARDGILRQQGWIGNEIILDQRTIDPEAIPPTAVKER